MALDITPRRFLFLDVSMKFGLWSGTTAPTQFLGPVNFTKLEFTPPKQEVAKIVSRMEGTVGQILASVQRPGGDSAMLAAEFDAAPPGLIALAMGATVSELTATGGTATGESVTTVLNTWVALAHQWIDESTFTMTGVTDKTKYELDGANGLIKAVHADAVGAKTVGYTYATVAGEIYAGGQATSSYVMLVGSGTEQATKKRCRIVVARANLAAAGAFDPATGEALKGSVKGEMETPSGYTSPWSYSYSNQASPY